MDSNHRRDKAQQIYSLPRLTASVYCHNWFLPLGSNQESSPPKGDVLPLHQEEIKTAVAGLGPATFSLTGRRYYQLSYTAINISYRDVVNWTPIILQPKWSAIPLGDAPNLNLKGAKVFLKRKPSAVKTLPTSLPITLLSVMNSFVKLMWWVRHHI